MNPDLSYVSVVEPIGPAIERVKTILFRPFDLGKWLVIGFSAWLAQLGSKRVNMNYRSSESHGGPREMYYEVKDYVLANLDWIIPLAAALFVVVVGLWLLMVWLSSRGRFSFLYCVAQNKGEFLNPWRQYRGHADSLFSFRVVLGILAFVVVVAFLALTGVVVASAIKTSGFGPYNIVAIVMCGLLSFAAMVVFGLIGMFTRDFVVPIMYLHNVKCTRAWRVLAGMISANMGRFILYVLFQFVIGLAIGVLVLGMMCICCVACCFLAIPYVGTVLLLPFIVFGRSYSLYYLAQYGPDFNVFEPEPEEVPPTAMQI